MSNLMMSYRKSGQARDMWPLPFSKLKSAPLALTLASGESWASVLPAAS